VSDVSDAVVVRRARADDPTDRAGLVEVVVDCVDGGASIGFLQPFGPERAGAFWDGELAAAGRGERVLLVAEDPATGAVVGTVQVVVAAPENQPHRGEITKMLVHRRARRRGVGERLMRAAEAAALGAGKTLLTLDTASPDAERLYDRLGWRRVGVIPDYALWPDGRPVDTLVLYKALTGSP
jgi:ribosomal protein S18 acetylase RimI-like enzyme